MREVFVYEASYQEAEKVVGLSRATHRLEFKMFPMTPRMPFLPAQLEHATTKIVSRAVDPLPSFLDPVSQTENRARRTDEQRQQGIPATLRLTAG